MGAKFRSNVTLDLMNDPMLHQYANELKMRADYVAALRRRLLKKHSDLVAFADASTVMGLQLEGNEWIYTDYLPHIQCAFLVGDFNNFEERKEFQLQPLEERGAGFFQLRLPKSYLKNGDHYLLKIFYKGQCALRVPAYARNVVQDAETNEFSEQLNWPAEPYKFKYSAPRSVPGEGVLIYEAHVGMSSEVAEVATFNYFRQQILPRIVNLGYNTIQLMACISHPYYGSFGYHVSNFYSISTRFGTPDEFKQLIDEAHRLGLRVIIDLVHSHAVKNTREGLAEYDGSRELFFNGEHPAWDSLCFNYADDYVLYFLLSNLRFLLEEYNLDGFRFDGITSMLYHHHGLSRAFTNYADYFNIDFNLEAFGYLALANELIHQLRPDAITVAEDVSGLPGLAAKSCFSANFDYRMAMGVTDYWFKLFDIPDEAWNMSTLHYELTSRRKDEKTISYVECHDQALVGGQSAIFRLVGAEMYTHMSTLFPTIGVDRAVALHKMSRLVTIFTAGNGYLNFMGNEFGHPEWIDFPRPGNNWSYHYARRQWSLADDKLLRYHDLWAFDVEMIHLLRQEKVFSETLMTIRVDEAAKVLIYERNGLWLMLNFHVQNSYAEYRFDVLPGEYELVLDSDAKRFGGFGRLQEKQCYHAQAIKIGNELHYQLSVYLPNRSAIVLKKI